MDWLNVAFLRMDTLMGRGAVLVEFWDFARVNSLRTMPYLKGWHARYADQGLRVIGIHSPGYSFGRDPDTVARAVERLEVPYAVLLDPDFEVWRLYGNKGWPGRYLFDRTGRLAFVHYGEGEYVDTELAIQESASRSRWSRWSRAARGRARRGLSPQTADIALPADRGRLELVRDWTDGEDWIEAGRRRGRGELLASARAAPMRSCPERASSPACTRARAPSRRTRPVCASTACSSRPGAAPDAQPRPPRPHPATASSSPRRRRSAAVGSGRSASALRISLGSMKRTSSWTTSNSETSLGAALAEEVDEPLHQLLGRARAGGDPHHALALEPLLLHLALVVDQVRVGAVVARDLDEPVRVRGVARADHQHEVALAGHLAHRHLAVGGGVTDVVGLRAR